ncbi:hypothetical protein AB1Y20_018640 [Prymnesium parvum]|uniref:Ribosome biogenesis protein NOP53 n=1 Tax=Prymnesium parvum TaxID=97485 RepID=A0AB34JPB8_PRYPA
MPPTPRALLVENRLCDHRRVSRHQQLHQQRLAEIAAGTRKAPLVQGPRDALQVAGARGTHTGRAKSLPSHHEYPHLSRRDPKVQTYGALQDRLEQRALDAELHRIRSRPGVVAAQQRKTVPPAELGRLDLNAAADRARRKQAARLAKENDELRGRIRSAEPRFASPSTIRTLHGKPPQHQKYPKALEEYDDSESMLG